MRPKLSGSAKVVAWIYAIFGSLIFITWVFRLYSGGWSFESLTGAFIAGIVFLIAGVGILARERWAWWFAVAVTSLMILSAAGTTDIALGGIFLAALVGLLAGREAKAPQEVAAPAVSSPAGATAIPPPSPPALTGGSGTSTTELRGQEGSSVPKPVEQKTALDSRDSRVQDGGGHSAFLPKGRPSGLILLYAAVAVALAIATGAVAYRIGKDSGENRGNERVVVATDEAFARGYSEGREDGVNFGRRLGEQAGFEEGERSGNKHGLEVGRRLGARSACYFLFDQLGTSRIFNRTGLDAYRYYDRSVCKAIHLYS